MNFTVWILEFASVGEIKSVVRPEQIFNFGFVQCSETAPDFFAADGLWLFVFRLTAKSLNSVKSRVSTSRMQMLIDVEGL